MTISTPTSTDSPLPFETGVRLSAKRWLEWTRMNICGTEWLPKSIVQGRKLANTSRLSFPCLSRPELHILERTLQLVTQRVGLWQFVASGEQIQMFHQHGVSHCHITPIPGHFQDVRQTSRTVRNLPRLSQETPKRGSRERRVH